MHVNGSRVPHQTRLSHQLSVCLAGIWNTGTRIDARCEMGFRTRILGARGYGNRMPFVAIVVLWSLPVACIRCLWTDSILSEESSRIVRYRCCIDSHGAPREPCLLSVYLNRLPRSVRTGTFLAPCSSGALLVPQNTGG